jgi:hypothetical protein
MKQKYTARLAKELKLDSITFQKLRVEKFSPLKGIVENTPGYHCDSVGGPVYSEIPVLVTNGRYDPDTPMAWGKELCRTLPNSHYFLFPGQSHLPLFQHSEGRRIGMEFLDNPYERPDDGGVTEKPFRFYPGE